jgi:hypothetical protein
MEDTYKQAVQLQFKMHDYFDDAGHQLAQQLKKMVQQVVDEIEMKKNPRSLEDRVKGVIRHLESLEGSSVMSNHHIDDLRDRCEDMRQALRKLF